jgi:hypothetical protein
MTIPCEDCETKTYDAVYKEGQEAKRVTDLSYLRAEGWEHATDGRACLVRKCAACKATK